MPGMLGRFAPRNINDKPIAPPALLHQTGVTELSEWAGESGFVQHARLDCGELKETVHKGDELRGWFCGDLPAREAVPWSILIAAVRDGGTRRLAELTTPFAAVIHETATGRVWLISDRRSQYPIFYRRRGDGLDVSTLASAFGSRLGGASFAPEWLYELLYFNYPVLDTTYYQDVRRLPPASILSWRIGDPEPRLESYAPPFARPESFVEGDQALEMAHAVFSEAAADCYRSTQPIAIALTAGFDSRSVLAYAPPRDQADLMTFTYGQPGCYDLNEAAAVAREMDLPHRSIEFDAAFRDALPRLATETVSHSDGQERVLRATLPHTFSALKAAGRRVLVSGLSGDHIFRDHIHGRGNVPALMSEHLMDFIETGDAHLDAPVYRDLFGADHTAFRAHIEETLEALTERHGPLDRPEGYVRYLVYENAPKYFGGEAALARRSLIYRTPFWDSRVVELAFSLDRGTVGLSTRLPTKDRYLEAALQAHLIGRSPHYGGVAIKGISARAYSRGNRSLYKLERALRLGPRKLKTIGRRPPVPPLEDWPGWLSGPLSEKVAGLLAGNTGIRAYLQPDMIRKLSETGDTIRIGQLLSADIVLDLIGRNWRSTY